MKMHTKISLDRLLILTAFLLALVIRFVKLGQAPLPDAEAELALQALRLADGSGGMISGQPAYILPTAVLFTIFGPGSAIARLIPALSGALLTLIPGFYRKELGTWAAVILSFAIALDPGLTAVSRQASGLTWGLLLALLAVTGIKFKKPVLAGISIGLAVLAGPHFWQGLVSAGVGYGFYRLFARRLSEADELQIGQSGSATGFIKRILPWAIASLALGGSLFLFVPRGISAAGSGVVEYINGWLGGSHGTFMWQLALALLVYELFGLGFALIQVIRIIFTPDKRPVDVALVFWWFSTLLFAFIYPARSMTGLAWSLIPMWALAARWLSEKIPQKRLEFPLLAAGQTILLFVLGIFTWLSLLGLIDLSRTPDEIRLRWIGAGGGLLLAVASVLLVNWGWSRSAARAGTIWAVTGLLTLWTISSLIHAAGLGRGPETQLWRSGPALLEHDLLLGSVGDSSEWNTGRRDTLDLSVIGVSSPALEWMLRDYVPAEYFDVIPIGTSPSMAITGLQETPGLAATYSGQDFRWTTQPAWSSMTIIEWFKWSVYKTAPLESDRLVLWVRTDRFPGAVENP